MDMSYIQLNPIMEVITSDDDVEWALDFFPGA